MYTKQQKALTSCKQVNASIDAIVKAETRRKSMLHFSATLWDANVIQ